MGVDPFEVMDLVCQDTQLNISKAYLKPGFAFGGSCLPKELRATTHLAKLHDVEIPMLGGIMQSNREHLNLALDKLMAIGKRRIGFIGLSFKTGTDDLRESPLVTLGRAADRQRNAARSSMTLQSVCRNCSEPIAATSKPICRTSASCCAQRSAMSSRSRKCWW